MAHELSHVGNRDTLLMTTLVVLVGSLALVTDLMFRMTWYGAGSRGSYKGKNGGGWLILLAARPGDRHADRRAHHHRRRYRGSASTWPTPQAPC